MDPANPASWDRYVYVLNNPMKNVDPNGEFTAEAAKWLQAKVDAAQAWVETKAISTGSPTVAALGAGLSGAGRDLINGLADMFRVGESSGTVWDSGDTSARIEAAIDDGLRLEGLLAVGLGATTGLATKIENSIPTNVTHFTSEAGKDAISASRELRSGSYVTKPGEAAGINVSQIESKLDIDPGKGQWSVTAKTTKGNLAVPENGPTVPGGVHGGKGGAWQRQIKEPVKINPKKFKKTPSDHD